MPRVTRSPPRAGRPGATDRSSTPSRRAAERTRTLQHHDVEPDFCERVLALSDFLRSNAR